jgi:hypothetical protein
VLRAAERAQRTRAEAMRQAGQAAE